MSISPAASQWFPHVQCMDLDPWRSAWHRSVRDSEDMGCTSRTTGAGNLSVSQAFFFFLAICRLSPRWAAIVAAIMVLEFAVALEMSGARLTQYGTGAIRTIIFAVGLSGLSILLASIRRDNAYAKWVASRNFSETFARHRDFLFCLMPPKVYQSSWPVASDGNRNGMQVTSPAEGGVRIEVSGDPGDTRPSRDLERPDHAEGAGAVAPPSDLTTYALDDILVMFCALPRAVATCDESNAQAVSAYLNNIFSLLDKEVLEVGCYKYHHILESYVVVSSAAALHERSPSFSLPTELAKMGFLAERFNQVLPLCHYISGHGCCVCVCVCVSRVAVCGVRCGV